MAEGQVPIAAAELLSPDQAMADFEKFLLPTNGEAETPEPEPTPSPDPEPVPAPDPEPAAVVAKGEKAAEAKVDRRTREGRLQSIQQQIDAETARRHRLKTEADEEEQRLTRLRAERTRLETPPAPPVQPPPTPQPQAEYKRFMAMPDAPKVDQFTGENAWQEYQFAVGHFIARKSFEEQSQQQATAVRHKAFTDRVQVEITKDPTFQERLINSPIDTRIIPYLHAHEQGPAIMVYLANNREAAQRLVTLNPNYATDLPSAQQIEAIGKIAGILEASAAASSGPASKSSPISQAKPLIKPVSAAPSVSDDDDEPDEADLSTEEFIRRRNKAENIPIPARLR